MSKTIVIDSLAAIGAELVFATLPLIVIAIIILTKHGGVHDVAASPEWSFGSAILVGQTLVKFVTGLVRANKVRNARVALVLAGFFAFGIAPAFTTLVLVTMAEKHVETWLVGVQVAVFCASMVAFLVLGGLGHIWSEERRSAAPESPRSIGAEARR